MARLSLADFPPVWFDRPQYRPRLESAGRRSWYLLDPAFRPTESVPTSPPREPPAGRARLREAFEATYSDWRLPLHDASRGALDAVGRKGTAVIVTGQQPGFLGGPLHTIYKALTAVAAARRRSALTGGACVPVFWVAGDDHDFEEVRRVRFPGSPDDVVLELPGDGDRRPLADYPIDDGALEVLGRAKTLLGARRHGAAATALIDLYPGRGLAGGFAALMAELLGPAGLLVLDPVKIRPLAARIFRGVASDPQKVLALVEAGRDEVRRLGIEPLVAGRLPLFLLRDGKRHHLSPTPDGVKVDGLEEEISVQDLLQQLAALPGCLSHGALLRPIVQEEALPVVLSIGGPAEVGYFAQLGPLAAHFGLERPRIALRLNATLFDGKPARLAGSTSLDVLARAASPEDLLPPPAAEPGDLVQLRSTSLQLPRELRAAVAACAAPGDTPRLEKRARDLEEGLASFVERLTKALMQARGTELDQARQVFGMMFPGGALQERTHGFLHHVAKHGTAWLQELLDALEPDPLRLVHRRILFESMGD